MSRAVTRMVLLLFWCTLLGLLLIIEFAPLPVAHAVSVDCEEPALPVIPGAAGCAMDTRAAYGGSGNPQIIEVTNTNKHGPGSLKACIDATGPRVCIFETSGTIDWSGGNVNITNPYITIAGQTAPSPGITIRGAALIVRTHDVLIQHIRLRAGGDWDGDPLAEPGYEVRDSLKVLDSDNVVIDHVSLTWGRDEIAENYNDFNDVDYRHVLFAEGLKAWKDHESVHPHSWGLLSNSSSTGRLSITGSLFANNNARNPFSTTPKVYFANNVIYNWMNYGSQFASDNSQDVLATVVGNVYIPDTVSSQSNALRLGGFASGRAFGPGTKIYVDDNDTPSFDGSDPWSAVTITSSAGWKSSMEAASPPFEVEGYQVLPSSQVEDWVLANVGARPADRDSVDERIIDTVINRTGNLIDDPSDVGGYPDLAENTRDLTPLLPENPHGDADGDGYTNVEEWLHSYAAAVEGTGTSPSGD